MTHWQGEEVSSSFADKGLRGFYVNTHATNGVGRIRDPGSLVAPHKVLVSPRLNRKLHVKKNSFVIAQRGTNVLFQAR